MDKIEERFIRAARKIREDYLNLSNGKNTPDMIGQKLYKDLENTQEKFKDITKKIENKSLTNAENAQNQVVGLLNELNKKMDVIDSYVDSFNSKVEALRKKEEQLYHQIKLKYPNLSDAEIISQISESITDLI